jgi:hypothetical protein
MTSITIILGDSKRRNRKKSGIYFQTAEKVWSSPDIIRNKDSRSLLIRKFYYAPRFKGKFTNYSYIDIYNEIILSYYSRFCRLENE